MENDIEFINFDEKGVIVQHVWSFLLYPVCWNDDSNKIIHTLIWNEVPFKKTEIDKVPSDKKGIYCFVLKPEVNQLFETRYLFYVGRTKRNFRKRFKEYLNDLMGKGKPRPRVYTMLKLWDKYLHFYYACLSDDGAIEECEHKLLHTLFPKVNSVFGKIKSEYKDIYSN